MELGQTQRRLLGQIAEIAANIAFGLTARLHGAVDQQAAIGLKPLQGVFQILIECTAETVA